MKKYLLLVLCCTLLVGCSLLTKRDDSAQAKAVVVAFFNHLSKGEYEQAAALYGADYQPLTYFNPNVPPEEHTALWRSACEVNGYQCLPVLRVIKTEKFSLNEYMVSVEFRDANGQAFVFGPCCGADEQAMPPQTQFEMFVVEQEGNYLVTSLPVFVP